MVLFKNLSDKKEEKGKKGELQTSDFSVSELSEMSTESVDLSKELEKDREQAREQVEQSGKERLESVEKDKPSQQSQQVTQYPEQPQSKSVELQRIEQVLSEDLEDIYFDMDEAHRKLFKEEGERTAREIETIIGAGKSVAVKVLNVIKKWLQFIPGVNKFFIEQEAKIKTDKILNF